MPTADSNDVAELRELEKTWWTESRSEMLETLKHLSAYDGVILRKEGPDARSLLLDDYRVGKTRPPGETFAIADRKSLRFWNGNAFTSCFRQNYPYGSLNSLSDKEQAAYSPEQREFLAKVNWRGSFPVEIDSGEQRLVILVGFDEDCPEWLDPAWMSLAWLTTQAMATQARCRREQGGRQESILNSFIHLPLLSALESRENQFAALLRLLCSGRALGWQRVWLMKRDQERLTCETCTGGLTINEWGNAAAFATGELASLVDEIAHDIVDEPRQNDGLFRACVRDNSFAVDASCLPKEPEYREDPERPKGTVIFQTPSSVDDFDCKGKWTNALNAVTPTGGETLTDDEHLYCCPFAVGPDDYVAVLSWNSRCTNIAGPSLIETGVVLAAASVLMSRENADVENKLEPERFLSVLRCLGTAPPGSGEFASARARRYGEKFLTSAAYRREVSERIRKLKAEM